MSLKDLQKRVRRKMSVESKKQLIAELRAEILRVCPFDYRPESDAESIRQMEIRSKEKIKNMERKVGKVTVLSSREFEKRINLDQKQVEFESEESEGVVLVSDDGYPKNDLSNIDDENLTKQQLFENICCMVMQELFFHPYRHLRLHMLNGREVWRRENKKAKDEGRPLPHPDKNPGLETEEERLERCFGIVEDQNRKF